MTTPEDILNLANQLRQGMVDRTRNAADNLQLANTSRPQVSVSRTSGFSEELAPQTMPEGLTGPYGLEPGLWGVIQKLQQMSPWGPDSIGVTSGYRDWAEQAELRARYERGEGPLAAKPGHSNHNWGRAADLHYASDEVRDWVHRMGQELGYYFPVPGEDWHIELVG